MNCKSIREAISTATRRSGYSETVRAHLSDCSDCRRHADQASALLALLGAQPRIEAPADFDFRLRARIARAKFAPATSTATLENFWTKSFSFGQAATAMAAIVVAVLVSTFYLSHRDEITAPNDAVAKIAAHEISPVTVPSGIAANPMAAPVSSGVPAVKSSPVVRPATIRNYRSPKLDVLQPASAVVAASATTVARVEDRDRVYIRAHKQVIETSPNREILVGAEGAVLTKPQAALSF